MFRTIRTAALALVCAAGVLAPTAASARQVEAEHYVDDETFEVAAHDPEFCADLDFAVIVDFHAEGFFHGVRRGDGLVYFSDHFRVVQTITNPANGSTLTSTTKGSNMDTRVVDNGDGTLTITFKFAGTTLSEFPTVTFRDAGLFVGQVLVDNGGTPGDPDDDELIEFLPDLKLVGRQDTAGRDFCADIAEFLG